MTIGATLPEERHNIETVYHNSGLHSPPIHPPRETDETPVSLPTRPNTPPIYNPDEVLFPTEHPIGPTIAPGREYDELPLTIPVMVGSYQA